MSIDPGAYLSKRKLFLISVLLRYTTLVYNHFIYNHFIYRILLEKGTFI